MNRICGIVERKLAEKSSGVTKKRCTVRHTSPFVPCTTGVVYQLPFSCGHVYIGQTGRCLNVRLSEHKRSLDGNAYSHVARHCAQHGCTPNFHDTICIFRHNNQATREIVEAHHINKKGNLCVSMPSIALHDDEICFLNRFIT